MKQVWLNINTGQFSQSWSPEDYVDDCLSETEIKDANARGYKLIEYTCLNDTNFELCDLMKVVTSDTAKNRQRKKKDKIV